jgi:hypothetical protein
MQEFTTTTENDMNFFIWGYLVWQMYGLAKHCINNGEKYTLNRPLSYLIMAISFGLLIAGGVFSVMNGWLLAFILWHIFCLIGVTLREDPTTNYSFLTAAFIVALNLFLLGKGGMFALLF